MKDFKCSCGETDPKNFYGGSNKGMCKKCAIEYGKKYYKENLIRAKINGAKSRAKYKNLEFDIDVEYIEKLLIDQNNRCFYSNIEFNNEIENISVSIDRIDSKKGYTKDNTRLVCSGVNLMKSDFVEEEFLGYIKSIYSNLFLNS